MVLDQESDNLLRNYDVVDQETQAYRSQIASNKFLVRTPSQRMSPKTYNSVSPGALLVRVHVAPHQDVSSNLSILRARNTKPMDPR